MNAAHLTPAPAPLGSGGARLALLVLGAVFLLAAPAGAQFVITRSVIAGGGGESSGGVFTVRGTIGQHAAGPASGAMTGGSFGHTSGFWAGLPCAVDFNSDGFVNTLDFIAFLNAFNAGQLSADWDGNGFINTIDFIQFLNDFNIGC